MSIPERIWRIVRGRWLLAEEQVHDALAEEAASRELSEMPPHRSDSKTGVARPRIGAPLPKVTEAARPQHDPLASDLAFLGAPPACDMETLDRIYQERLAELDQERNTSPSLDPHVFATRRAALSEAYERLRDAINTTETRFEKLEF